jgi:phage recombination protein Bet
MNMNTESKKNEGKVDKSLMIREEMQLEFTPEKLQLLKDTICKGITNDELSLFKHVCAKTGLDPFMRQIYPVKRYDSALKREAMAIQVGIDGYRLIADRTGRYAPGRETTYVYDKDGNLFSATAYVKKQTNDGTWHEISATAFYSEYAGLTRDGTPTIMWKNKKHIMLGKCAEACALRKAYPAELSGVYTHEEMQQADNKIMEAPSDEVISKEQADELISLLETCPKDFAANVTKWVTSTFGRFDQIKEKSYSAVLDRIRKKLEEPISVKVEELDNAADQ